MYYTKICRSSEKANPSDGRSDTGETANHANRTKRLQITALGPVMAVQAGPSLSEPRRREWFQVQVSGKIAQQLGHYPSRHRAKREP